MRGSTLRLLIGRIGDAAFGWLRRKPTLAMRQFALAVARDRGIEIPRGTLRSFSKTRDFLNRYSGYRIN